MSNTKIKIVDTHQWNAGPCIEIFMHKINVSVIHNIQSI